MKKILVPTDFTECAANALKQAIFIAKKTGAELHLYHVAALHPYWKELSEKDNKLYTENLERALKIQQKLQDMAELGENEDLIVRTSYTHGNLIENIGSYVADNNIDLVVIGTHGASGYREWIIGSNTQKILRRVPCPLLAIKHDLVYREFNDIAFISDFKEESVGAFKESLDFASIFNSRIFLYNIDEPGFFSDPVIVVHKAMKRFKAIADERGIECNVNRLPVGDLEEILQSEIKEDGIDLVVIPTHGRSSLSRLFVSSMAETIVNHMEIPVLTMLIRPADS